MAKNSGYRSDCTVTSEAIRTHQIWLCSNDGSDAIRNNFLVQYNVHMYSIVQKMMYMNLI